MEQQIFKTQQKLDVFAHELFIKTLTNRKIVCGIASEEADDFIRVVDPDLDSKYVVLIDPLDGSSNIDVNVSLGTIFSIYRKKSKGNKVVLEDFLQPGNEQVAAGYILYGTSTLFVYTTGQGVNGFTLNPAIGTFYLSHPNITLPTVGHIYSINEANFDSFPQQIKDYLKKTKADDDQYTTRYIGSMVSDIHRNMLKRGIVSIPSQRKISSRKITLVI